MSSRKEAEKLKEELSKDKIKIWIEEYVNPERKPRYVRHGWAHRRKIVKPVIKKR